MKKPTNLVYGVNDKPPFLQLAGYLVGKLAERVSTSAKGNHQHINLHFEH